MSNTTTIIQSIAISRSYDHRAEVIFKPNAIGLGGEFYVVVRAEDEEPLSSSILIKTASLRVASDTLGDVVKRSEHYRHDGDPEAALKGVLGRFYRCPESRAA